MDGVIFDMDGVLVDSYQPHLKSWQELARRHGLEMTEEQFAATFGRTSREIIRQLWGNQVAEGNVAAMDAEKESLYRDVLRADFPEMDGAEELIAALASAGFALAIGSSGPPENVEVVMERLPSSERFAATVHGREVSHGKPHPEVFLKAAEKLGVPANRCTVIEDAVPGVQAARSAEMACVALTGTTTREELSGAGADLVVDSLRQLTPERIAAILDARPA